MNSDGPRRWSRGAAIRQQLLELPAPVVADAFGYHAKTTSQPPQRDRLCANRGTKATNKLPRDPLICSQTNLDGNLHSTADKTG